METIGLRSTVFTFDEKEIVGDGGGGGERERVGGGGRRWWRWRQEVPEESCFSFFRKWSKGKQKEKVNNMVLFDKATYDKLLAEALKWRFRKWWLKKRELWLLMESLIINELLKPAEDERHYEAAVGVDVSLEAILLCGFDKERRSLSVNRINE
ncbi:hypothetical protein L1987_70941 [Smallanthus sonchifolius]|uniref:Uncharacterized protein n=1 Tax=Smallanthus sonchifolius TaxID=185202 RepID=A0ACB9AR05_9ASTR|nr:hypothetical protein L1987_70941 [Smallanthus sonchifolius]